MGKQSKTKSELLLELENLKQKYDSLSTIYESLIVTPRNRDNEKLQQWERLAHQQEILAAIATSTFFNDGEIEKLSHILTSRVSKYMAVERVSVWLFDETETELQCVDLFELSQSKHSSGTILKETEYKYEFEALKTSLYVDANDPLTDPRTAGYIETYLKPCNITSMLDSVIRNADKTLGVLCIEHVNTFHTWNSEEITFACQLSDQIVLAISNRERRRAEELLRESAKQYTDLLAELPDAVFIHKDGIILYVNNAACVGTEYTSAELIGTHVLNYVAEEHRPIIMLKLQQRLSGETVGDYECNLIRKSGKVASVIVRADKTIFRGEPAILFILIDITERKRTEEELRMNNARLELALSSSGQGLWDWDIVHDITYLSPKYYEIIGYKEGEIKPNITFFNNSLHPQDATRVARTMQEHMQGLSEYSKLKYRIQTQSGNYVWVDAIGKVVERANDGSPLRMIGFMSDITEPKVLEEKYRENQRFLSDIVEYNGAAMYAKDLHGRYILGNKKWADVDGFERDYAIGKTDVELFPETTGQAFHAADLEVMRLGTVQEFEETL